MALTVQLPPELDQRLTHAAAERGLPAEELVVRVLDQHLPPVDRRQALLAVLDGWIEELKNADFPAEGDEDDEFFRNLDANRLSDRPLFPPEKKGVTW